MTCAGLLGQELTAAADRLSSLNYRWLRGDKKWVTPDWDSEPRVLGGLTVRLLCCFREVLTIPAIGYKQ